MKFNYEGNNCYPVDTDTDMWVAYEIDLASLLERIAQKWPGKSLGDVEIKAVHHHEYAVGYDLYDGGDYVQYLYVSLEE